MEIERKSSMAYKNETLVALTQTLQKAMKVEIQKT